MRSRLRKLGFAVMALSAVGVAYALPGVYPATEYPFYDPQTPRMGDFVLDPPGSTTPRDIKTQADYNDLVSDWIFDANRRSLSLKGDVEVLKKKVADLESEIAKLKQQPQQPGGGKPAASDTARFEALEARVAKLEGERGVFKAPLAVIGTGGKPVLRLSADGTLLLGSDATNLVGLFANPGAPARMGVQSRESAVQLSAGNGKATVEVFNGETSNVTIAASATELGLVVEKNGQPAAGLGAPAGKSVALRLYDKSGKTIAAAGENPATPGTGLVSVGNGSRNGAALAANPDSSGVVHAFAADGTVGSGLIGVDRMVAAYNKSGAAVVTIGKSENSEGGNVTSRDPAGDGVFRAGFNSAVGGGDACVFRAKKQQTYCLGLGVPGVGVVGR